MATAGMGRFISPMTFTRRLPLPSQVGNEYQCETSSTMVQKCMQNNSEAWKDAWRAKDSQLYNIYLECNAERCQQIDDLKTFASIHASGPQHDLPSLLKKYNSFADYHEKLAGRVEAIHFAHHPVLEGGQLLESELGKSDNCEKVPENDSVTAQGFGAPTAVPVFHSGDLSCASIPPEESQEGGAAQSISSSSAEDLSSLPVENLEKGTEFHGSSKHSKGQPPAGFSTRRTSPKADPSRGHQGKSQCQESRTQPAKVGQKGSLPNGSCIHELQSSCDRYSPVHTIHVVRPSGGPQSHINKDSTSTASLGKKICKASPAVQAKKVKLSSSVASEPVLKPRPRHLRRRSPQKSHKAPQKPATAPSNQSAGIRSTSNEESLTPALTRHSVKLTLMGHQKSVSADEGLDEDLQILERLVEDNHERLMQEWLLVEDAVEQTNDSWYRSPQLEDKLEDADIMDVQCYDDLPLAVRLDVGTAQLEKLVEETHELLVREGVMRK